MNKRLIILLGLAALTWVLATTLPLGKKDADPAAALTWPPDLGKASALTLTARGQDTVITRKDGAARVRLAGTNATRRADKAKVQALLDFVAGHKPKRVLGPLAPDQAETYGLKTPSARLAVGEPAFELSLGGTNPTGDGVYAVSSAARDTLLLLDAGYKNQLAHSPEDFLDLRLLDFKDEAVTAARMAPGKEPLAGRDPDGFVLEKAKDSFAFAAPEALKALKVSPQAVRAWLRDLSQAKAAAVEPVALPTSGPVFTLEIAVKDGPAQTLTLYRDLKRPKVYIANSTFQPGRLRLEEEQLARLAPRVFDLRDRAIIALDTAKVDGFAILQDNRSLKAKKAQAGWTDAQSGKPITGIDMTLWRLIDLKFETEPREGLPSGADSDMVWRLTDKDGKDLAVATFFSDPALPPGRCWVKIGEKDQLFQISDQILKDLQGLLPAKAAGN